MEIALAAAKTLNASNRWSELERLARRGYEVDISVEEFSVYLMRALIESGSPQRAIDHFAYVSTALSEQYGVTPSQEMQLMHAEALARLYGSQLTKGELQEFLSEGAAEGAYYCDCGVFRELVRVNARSLTRNGAESQLLILTLQDVAVAEKAAVQMKRMEEVVTRSLRTGDPFTKLSTSRLLVLLPGASPENGRMIADRIANSFRRTYPRAGANFRYDLYDIASLEII